MGRHHLQEIIRAGMKPLAVTDKDPERLKVAAKDFPGIETYESLAAMLKKSKVHLVVIITPHNTHAKLALKALRSGRHVVCEKPFAINTAECDAMIKAARMHRVIVSAYHNRHWDGCILNAAKKIRSGVIGDVIRVEAHMGGYGKPGDWWRSSKSISGGILYDWGAHLLEYSLQIMNDEMTEVSGYAKWGHWASQTGWKEDTNEDEAFAVVRFKSGRWLTLTISSIDSNPKVGQLEITGTKGSYVFDGRSYTIISHKKGELLTMKGGNPDSEGWRFYQNVADHLTKGKDLVISGEWARRPIHILDLAGKSAVQGRAMKAKYA